MNPQLANVIESLIDAKFSLWELRRRQYTTSENLDSAIKAELIYLDSTRAELADLLP